MKRNFSNNRQFRFTTISVILLICFFIGYLLGRNYSSVQPENTVIASPTPTPGLTSSELITWKDKCAQIGKAYSQKMLSDEYNEPPYNQDAFGQEYNPGNDVYGYSPSLNTCLIYYQTKGNYFGNSNEGMESMYMVEDTLTNTQIAEYTDNSYVNEKPKPRSNGDILKGNCPLADQGYKESPCNYTNLNNWMGDTSELMNEIMVWQ